MIAAAALPTIAKDIARELKRGRLAAARGIARTARRRPDLGAEKIVSREYGYIWLCNPKVASRSIMATLCAITPDAEVFKGHSVARIFALRPETRRYYRFGFVRHPFARALSFHAELHRFAQHWRSGSELAQKREKRDRLCDRCHGLADTIAFDDYCRWLQTPYAADAVADRHFLSQHAQLRGDDGVPLNFIGRFEHLDADFRRVVDRLGLPKAALPKLNATAGWQRLPTARTAAESAAGSCLTPTNKALLAARYAQDLQFGGYAPA